MQYNVNLTYLFRTQTSEEKLDDYMRANGAREKSLAIEKGKMEDGVPYITVIVDGGWSKRSYGHAYNASSGVVSNFCVNII